MRSIPGIVIAALAVSVAIAVSVATAGCSGAADSVEADDSTPVALNPDPVWTCSYLPTMDYNWHNDILCSNGRDERRPLLLKRDKHITRAEIVAAGHRYEAKLNAQR